VVELEVKGCEIRYLPSQKLHSLTNCETVLFLSQPKDRQEAFVSVGLPYPYQRGFLFGDYKSTIAGREFGRQ